MYKRICATSLQIRSIKVGKIIRKSPPHHCAQVLALFKIKNKAKQNKKLLDQFSRILVDSTILHFKISYSFTAFHLFKNKFIYSFNKYLPNTNNMLVI